MRSVACVPGCTVFTVIPSAATSRDIVFRNDVHVLDFGVERIGGKLIADFLVVGELEDGLGSFFALDLAAWHIGILQTKLANATLFANVASLLFPVWGFILARSLPSRLEGVALAFAVAGTVLLLGRSAELSTQTLIGDLLCLAAGVFYTAYLIAIMKAREEVNNWVLLAWSTLATAPPLVLIAWGLDEQIMPGNWTPVILLAIISQLIGQGLMVYVLGKVSPLLFGLALLTQPIISALVGWLAYSEMLTLVDAMGAMLIAAGLVMVRLAETPSKA